MSTKRLPKLVGVMIILCLAVSCDYQKRREARAGLDASVDQLPQVEGFETITITYEETSITAHGATCYYAEAEVMLGTLLTVEETFDTYIDELQALGWLKDRRQYENTKGLTRGSQERIVIRSYYTWWDEKNEAFIRAKEIYPTIIFVRLVFYVPQRDRC